MEFQIQGDNNLEWYKLIGGDPTPVKVGSLYWAFLIMKSRVFLPSPSVSECKAILGLYCLY